MSESSVVKMPRKAPRSGRAKSVNPDVESPLETPPETVSIEQMIAEAAYYRAEQRGFQGGDPVDDWLQAEAAIERRIREMRE